MFLEQVLRVAAGRFRASGGTLRPRFRPFQAIRADFGPERTVCHACRRRRAATTSFSARPGLLDGLGNHLDQLLTVVQCLGDLRDVERLHLIHASIAHPSQRTDS